MTARPPGALARLYDRVLELAARREAVWTLAAVSLAESFVFPIPPDLLLIPMVLAARNRAWAFAAVCTIASVLGGMVGYAIGYFLYESIGREVLEFYSYADGFARFGEVYNRWGAWVVFVVGVTPFPYKAITILSGTTRLDPAVFVLASLAARGLRFFLVAALLYWFGPPIRAFVEKRLGLALLVFCALLLGGFAVAKYVS